MFPARVQQTEFTGLLASIREQPPTPISAAGLSFHDGVLIDSGRIIYRSGFHPGRSSHEGLRFRSRPDTRKKTGLFPKLNRMTHPPHSVKVETQVMQGI